ncbi:MAG: RusA family crossover junction endodeoxyribonuclease [Candidatus Hodarchaeales archaeon]
MIFDFLIPKRPVSHQTSNRKNLQNWKKFVFSNAQKGCSDAVPFNSNVHLTLIYLYDEDPVDVDNIIKPIQDALQGIFYDDDRFVSDVESHRRILTGSFDITKYPKELIRGVYSGNECVYVRVSDSKPLEKFLI